MQLKRFAALGTVLVAVLSLTLPNSTDATPNQTRSAQGSAATCDQAGLCGTTLLTDRQPGATSALRSAPTSTDPDLEPGFPVQAPHRGGLYSGGQSINALVGNIDQDPQLEIIATALARGPLYAWNADGSLVNGWEPNALSIINPAYPALAELDPTTAGHELAVAYLEQGVYTFTGNAQTRSGWPYTANTGLLGHPPVSVDIDDDGIDELFVGSNAYEILGLKADGTALPGWPVRTVDGYQGRSRPTVADVDGDDRPDILVLTGHTSSGQLLYAYHADGSVVPGFPWRLQREGNVGCYGNNGSAPVVGDVDGDGAVEIVLQSGSAFVCIYSGSGILERTFTTEGSVGYGSAPALADLDGDHIPEIILQTESHLNVWRGNGSVLPGWPLRIGGQYSTMNNSSPVVGDVDGDSYPDIVITTGVQGIGTTGHVHALDRFGHYLPRFPKEILSGSGGVPAIADIDRDGRNEMIIVGDYWDGVADFYDKVWVYDLGGCLHGRVEWGQYGGNGRHQGKYPVVPDDVVVHPDLPQAVWLPLVGTVRCT